MILRFIAAVIKHAIARSYGQIGVNVEGPFHHHPELGAAMVAATAAAGGQTDGGQRDADVVRLIREQEAPSPDTRLAILQAADEA